MGGWGKMAARQVLWVFGPRPGAGLGRVVRTLLLLLWFAARGGALYFHIGETEKKCFIEEIPDETMVIGAGGAGRARSRTEVSRLGVWESAAPQTREQWASWCARGRGPGAASLSLDMGSPPFFPGNYRTQLYDKQREEYQPATPGLGMFVEVKDPEDKVSLPRSPTQPPLCSPVLDEAEEASFPPSFPFRKIG